MKKISVLALIILFSEVLVGCDGESSSTKTEEASQQQVTTSPTSSEQAASSVENQKVNFQFNQNYEIQHTLPFIKLEGFSDDEHGGVWTDSRHPTLTLYVSRQKLAEHPVGTINLQVAPFLDLAHDLKIQYVNILWGKKHGLTDGINAEKKISLAYSLDDWTVVSDNSELQQLVIHFGLPNAISPQKLLKTNSDKRMLGLCFMQLSFS